MSPKLINYIISIKIDNSFIEYEKSNIFSIGLIILIIILLFDDNKLIIIK